MKTVYRLTAPDSVEATLTVTMTVGEWKMIAAELDAKKWPSWVFSDHIFKLVKEANERFEDEMEIESKGALK